MLTASKERRSDLSGAELHTAMREIAEAHKDAPLSALVEMPLPKAKKFLPFRFEEEMRLLAQGLEERIAHLEKINKEQPLGVEGNHLRGVQWSIHKELSTIRRLIKGHEDSRNRRERYAAAKAEADKKEAKIRKKYPVELNPAALAEEAFWVLPRTRNEYPAPKLAVFHIEDPTCEVQSKFWDRGRRRLTGSYMPGFVRRAYRRFHNHWRYNNNDESIGFSVEFSGAIPEPIREKIREAKEFFGRDIFLIAEASQVKLHSTTAIRDGDPLVVGAFRHKLFLIADFDTTSLEQQYLFRLPGEKQK